MPDDIPAQIGMTPEPAPEFGEREAGLLAAARAAFVEKGFDGASMQDLARSAGMSAGNFYRYFPSKAAIVEAMVARDLAAVEDEFRLIAASPRPIATLRTLLRKRMEERCGGEETLWAEITAAAARKPEVAAILARMEDGIVRRLARVMGLAVGGLSEDEALHRFGTPARLIYVIMHGAMSSHLLRDARDAALAEQLLQTIERIMLEACSCEAEG